VHRLVLFGSLKRFYLASSMLKVTIILVFGICGVHAANLSRSLQEESDLIVWFEEKFKKIEEKDKEFEERLNLFDEKGIIKRFSIVY
jgi:hypothetical protein